MSAPLIGFIVLRVVRAYTTESFDDPSQIAGPKSTTEPQAGLNTTTRAQPLAQAIVDWIVTNGSDPSLNLLYNPLNVRCLLPLDSSAGT